MLDTASLFQRILTSAADAASIFIDNASDVTPAPMAQHLLDEENKLFFQGGDETNTENIFIYRQHGFHPIVFGEILPKAGICVTDKSRAPQYRIFQKLGFGAFATVWLARDLFKLSESILPIYPGFFHEHHSHY